MVLFSREFVLSIINSTSYKLNGRKIIFDSVISNDLYLTPLNRSQSMKE